ncbi:PmoA family protein [Actinoplanes rectilineatus]|uniref:DUF6807 domain-containing protein n=1 Tax=Actinoplanes rectilineatus TaxID=113571 RepID=UPI0005F2EC84|nr:PmoA family protein [Actinoplanes rectilineatus]
MPQAHALTCAGRVVARYVWEPDLPATVSPRPYLHPVTTLGGATVTGFMPTDHRHHLGASVAVPVVNDANFWGGRTYLRDRGSVHLDNHGRQRHARWLHRTGDRLAQELDWVARDGQVIARERRVLSTSPLTDTAWTLRFEYALSSADDRTLTLCSPAVRGRAGAGYGGFFWRAPAGPATIRAFARDGGADVHGSREPWIALGTDTWTLTFHTGTAGGDPWFVRSADYAGVCSAIAWDRPLVIAPGQVFTRRIAVVVADGPAAAFPGGTR